MFTYLVYLQFALVAGGMTYSYVKTRDVFHPLFLLLPTFGFIYGYMPYRLEDEGTLIKYFTAEQLIFVQGLNCAGTLAFIIGAIAAGTSVQRPRTPVTAPSRAFVQVLINGASIIGAVALAAWTVGLINVGGFVNAFSRAYAGGWDDSGYVRDITIWMLGAIIILLLASTLTRLRLFPKFLVFVFASPWIIQALLTARRGPTFMITVIVAMSYYFQRDRRPSLIKSLGAAVVMGYVVLFLVVNRASLYLGSDLSELNTEVGSLVAADDTGNEFIYGAGSVIAAERTGHHFWGRRYLAQFVVRPIPSAIWPDKYEAFGVPELLHNAGTGEGFLDNLGWQGAVGSAPGIVADLWVELRWGFAGALFAIGWLYAWLWRRAIQERGPWLSQYVIVCALSLSHVMQTLEAVIYRGLLLSIPLWLTWSWARYVGIPRLIPVFVYPPSVVERRP